MAGWDTDCNVGNVGAIMGVALGLEGIDRSWREPMNDLLITASIIGTRNILTIPQCADLFCRLGRQLAGETAEVVPHYHFHYRGSTNNFQAHGARGRIIELRQTTLPDQRRALQVSLRKLGKKGESRVYTRTYYRPEELSSNYYEATFSPLIYPGQMLTAQLFPHENAPDSIRASLYVYDDHHCQSHQAPAQALRPGAWHTLKYNIPRMSNVCFSEAGIVLRNTASTVWSSGSVYLGSLDWDGAPDYSADFSKERPESGGISQWTRLRGYWRLENGAYHGSGVDLCETYSGDINWRDYALTVTLIPIVGEHHNINMRVQGALRSYAFGLAPDNRIALYKKERHYRPVASADFLWRHREKYSLTLTAQGDLLTARIQGDGREATLEWRDNQPYRNGQIGLSTWHGSHTRYTSIDLSPNRKR